jgi:hypothetical protein
MTDQAVAQAVPETVIASETPTQDSAPIQKHKLKINGKEAEFTLDEMKVLAQKGESADQRFRDASKMQGQFQDFQKKLESGELDWMLEKVPADKMKQFAESYLLKYLEEQELPDGERRARQLEKELEKERNEKKKLFEEATAKEKQALMDQAFQEVDTEIGAALKAMGRKPTPRLVARIAETMLAHLEAKNEHMPANDALVRSLDEVKSDSVEFLKTLPAEELRQLLPKETLEALRKADVQAVMSQDPLRSRQREKTPPSKANGKSRPMSSDDYFKKLEERLGG